LREGREKEHQKCAENQERFLSPNSIYCVAIRRPRIPVYLPKSLFDGIGFGYNWEMKH
jgi:hypothetical protein